jgi:hypothetical protein
MSVLTVSRLSLSIMAQAGKVKSLLLIRLRLQPSQPRNLWERSLTPFEMTNPCELSSFRVLREAQHKLSEKSFSTGLLRSPQFSNQEATEGRVLEIAGIGAGRLLSGPDAGYFSPMERKGRWPTRHRPIDRDRKGSVRGRNPST